jgi:hypothetical protein
VNKKTGQEVVYYKDKTIVTNEYRGTYNYILYNKNKKLLVKGVTAIGHFLTDMLPYYLGGTDKSNFTDIIKGLPKRLVGAKDKK